MIPGYQEFVASLNGEQPPVDLDGVLRALWYDARGETPSAHRAAHATHSHAALRVRAYLARKEGDVNAARRWYLRAGARFWAGTLASEWEDILCSVLVERVVEQAYH